MNKLVRGWIKGTRTPNRKKTFLKYVDMDGKSMRMTSIKVLTLASLAFPSILVQRYVRARAKVKMQWME